MATQVWTGAVSGDLSVSGNWLSSSVPASGDDVYFPPGSPPVTAGLTALNTSTLSGSLGAVIVQPGCNASFGSAMLGYVQLTCTSFTFSGGGVAYFDLQASAIAPQILATANASQAGYYGLYLIGSALTTVNATGGVTGIAINPGETASVTTATIIGSSTALTIGSGVTLTTLYCYSGTATLGCAATTVNVDGGTLTTFGTGAITTVNVNGGALIANATGTISTLNLLNGTANFLGSGLARTVSSLKLAGGSITYDPAILTVSAFASPGMPVQLSSSRASS